MIKLNRPHEIGLLLYPGVLMSAVMGLTDLLFYADMITRERLGITEPIIRVSHLRPGETMEQSRVYDTMPGEPGLPSFVIMVPCLRRVGVEGFDRALVDWLRDQHSAGAILGSVCGGAFLLAQTGLLNGRSVTTHYSLAEELGSRFPDVAIEPDRILIDNGDLMTAGGLMAWTDLGLHIVERTLGPVAMAETARFLVLDPPRAEQRLYSVFSPKLEHGDEAILKVQNRLTKDGSRGVSVAAMASWSGLEERTFMRRFKKATGFRPNDYFQRFRIGMARELLSNNRQPIEKVAWTVGYEDGASFRKIFLRLTGLNPSEYRKRFGVG